jgi:Spy/CpxP family protein refolding chaperone
MTRAFFTAVAAALLAGSVSLAAYAQSSSTTPSTTQSPGARVGGAMGQSGMSVAPENSRMSETQVRSMLEKQGFTDVSDIEQRGEIISARGMRNGQMQRVLIDTRTGMMQTGG